MEEEETQVSERDHVEKWREECLVKSGYERDYAAQLAQDFLIDLHRACELLSAGCSQALAVEILS